jgi:2-keto-myo-inositol isomerase
MSFGSVTFESGRRATDRGASGKISCMNIGKHQFSFCLNTSTIDGQQLTLIEQIELAGKCGYDGIEIWVRSLQQHLDGGGAVSDVVEAAWSAGVAIENAIGFSPWVVDDPETRDDGMAQAAREMAMVHAIGCRRIAAPPAGAVEHAVDLADVALRFDRLNRLGNDLDVTPQLELWGFALTLGTLPDLMHVASNAQTHPVRILLDAYHLYRGGSNHRALELIAGEAIEVFHLNDFPVEGPRSELTDADRVYPGDGQGPICEIVQLLAAKRTPIVLSLELFNRDYWGQPAEVVATTGLVKMRSTVELALG